MLSNNHFFLNFAVLEKKLEKKIAFCLFAPNVFRRSNPCSCSSVACCVKLQMISHVLVHGVESFLLSKRNTWLRRRRNELMTSSERMRWCALAAAGQRHIGVHVWTHSTNGTTTRHAGADENQEEEFTHGKLSSHTPDRPPAHRLRLLTALKKVFSHHRS